MEELGHGGRQSQPHQGTQKDHQELEEVTEGGKEKNSLICYHEISSSHKR